jgi:hypothetical protein
METIEEIIELLRYVAAKHVTREVRHVTLFEHQCRALLTRLDAHTAPVEVPADDEGSALAGWLKERGLISAHDLPMAMGELLDTLSNHEAELVKAHPSPAAVPDVTPPMSAERWRSDGGEVTAYAKLPGAITGSDHASSLGPLTGDERKAVGGVMVNAEHDAIDVEDACPSIEANEDAYWAWHTYHGLKKLVAIGDRQEALEASLKLERECHAISYRNATALGERVHRLECAIRAISASLSSGGTGHDLDENDPVILELREQITRLTQGGGLIPSNDALQDGLDAAKNAGAEGVDIGVIADIFNSVQAAVVAERNKDAVGT